MVGIVVKLVSSIARTLLTRERAYKLATWWAVRDQLPEDIDTIVLVSFGATKSGLSRGAETTTTRVLAHMTKYPQAVILYGEFTKNPVEKLERRLKSMRLGPEARFAGRVISTIEEEEACMEAHPSTPHKVLIVSDEAHSRGVKWVGRKVWGKPEIFVDCVSSRDVIDPENPMETLRDPRDWIAVNIFRQIILWIPGGFWFLKRSGAYQPSSEISA